MQYANNFIIFVFVAAGITAFHFALDVFLGPTYGGDIEWYIAAAEGRWNELIEPYSARFLHPFLTAALSKILSLEIHQSFLVIAIASVFLFFITSSFILKDIFKSPLLLLPLFFLPYFFDILRHTFHPDAFYLMLTSVFFLFLYYGKEAWSLFVLFLLFLTRESTILLGLIFTGISWYKSKKLLSAAIMAVVMISVLTTNSIKSLGEPNRHNLSSSVYLVSKLSYNFMTNVVGVVPWANTYDSCEPAMKFPLPKPLGKIREVGICGFNFFEPAKTLLILLAVFGVAPLVLAFLFIKRRAVFYGLPFWVQVAVIYGVAHYALGVVAGTGVARLVGYGWPAFLLATPILIKDNFRIEKFFVIKLSLVHLLTAWAPFVVQRTLATVSSMFISILIVFVLYFYTFRMLEKNLTYAKEG